MHSVPSLFRSSARNAGRDGCSRSAGPAGCTSHAGPGRAGRTSRAVEWLAGVVAAIGAAAASPAMAATLDDAAMAERLEACAACHGDAGRSDNAQYFPSIAGKPAGYLHTQIHNFREGRRRHMIMEGMFANMTDQYIAEIAAYYARQAPDWSPPTISFSDAALERGRTLVLEGDPQLGVPSCASCHGETLKGVAPDIPSLLGMRPEYLSAQLGAWRSGTRRGEAPDCMARVAESLTPADVTAVTAYIASQPYPEDPAPQTSLDEPLPLECGSVQ